MNKTIIAFTVLLVLGLSAVASATKSVKAHSKAVYNSKFSRPALYTVGAVFTFGGYTSYLMTNSELASSINETSQGPDDAKSKQINPTTTGNSASSQQNQTKQVAVKADMKHQVAVKAVLLGVLLPWATGYFGGQLFNGKVRTIVLSVHGALLLVASGLFYKGKLK